MEPLNSLKEGFLPFSSTEFCGRDIYREMQTGWDKGHHHLQVGLSFGWLSGVPGSARAGPGPSLLSNLRECPYHPTCHPSRKLGAILVLSSPSSCGQSLNRVGSTAYTFLCIHTGGSSVQPTTITHLGCCKAFSLMSGYLLLLTWRPPPPHPDVLQKPPPLSRSQDECPNMRRTSEMPHCSSHSLHFES